MNLLYKNPRLTKPIIAIPFGAAFNFISGVKSQAPKWDAKCRFRMAFQASMRAEKTMEEISDLWVVIYCPCYISKVIDVIKIKRFRLASQSYNFAIIKL